MHTPSPFCGPSVDIMENNTTPCQTVELLSYCFVYISDKKKTNLMHASYSRPYSRSALVSDGADNHQLTKVTSTVQASALKPLYCSGLKTMAELLKDPCFTTKIGSVTLMSHINLTGNCNSTVGRSIPHTSGWKLQILMANQL